MLGGGDSDDGCVSVMGWWIACGVCGCGGAMGRWVAGVKCEIVERRRNGVAQRWWNRLGKKARRRTIRRRNVVERDWVVLGGGIYM